MQQRLGKGWRGPQGAPGGLKTPYARRPWRPPWHDGARLLAGMATLGGWRGMLRRLRLSEDEALRLAVRADLNGTELLDELYVAGLVPEDALYRALADEIGLAFEPATPSGALVLRDRELLMLLSRPRGQLHVRTDAGGPPGVLLSSTRLNPGEARRRFDGRADLVSRLRLVAPGSLRAALLDLARRLLLDEALRGLFAARPDLSARQGATSWQGLTLGLLLIGGPVAYALAPGITVWSAFVVITAMFFMCVGLRLAALTQAHPADPRPPAVATARALPVYTILIALHSEAEIIDDLFDALARIVWPRSKLEIKFVCEADDAPTLAAIARQRLRPWMEIIRVPPCQPRTKPKALAFALPAVGGELVALYDAEDRPHPMQLLEAWQRFRDGDERLACVQAPLVVANAAAGALPRMFQMEYALHFNGILPWLSRHGLSFPLGGTSNHFRRRALIAVGGWDPYNVTEDADLGTRFARFGYRCETITCPTLEDAPDEVGVWLRQRTRWFKGWIQTWFVHMRRPARFYREVGAASFIAVQVMFAGMIASALAHPVLLASIAYLGAKLGWAGTLDGGDAVLLALALFNMVLGYGSFLALGLRCLDKADRRGFWKNAALTPAYWLLMSAAALRACWQICWWPHYWEKTPHKRHAGTEGETGSPHARFRRSPRPPQPAGPRVSFR
ncbi:glycosyltransferase family 2 protein [Nitratireductor sp. StC3]|uniref:glycosyltransferase family 2 protein n=1 Tax=Nitratireductor sp. StC3 TaxID=2126741 RepID=UPI001FDFB5EA|nr:glycosyltransferase family 2 protein [Nitratireductor sp. StC3]